MQRVIRHSLFFLICFFISTLFAQSPLVVFEQNGRFGYQTPEGNPVIPPLYVMAMEFSAEGIASVVDDSGWVYIDSTGTPLIRPYVVDNGPDYFRENRARFIDKGKTGFMNRNGEMVIRAAFFHAEPFSEGRAAVCRGGRHVHEDEYRRIEGGRWGYIDTTGNTVIPFRYDRAEPFISGRAKVYEGNQWYYIDREGVRIPDE